MKSSANIQSCHQGGWVDSLVWINCTRPFDRNKKGVKNKYPRAPMCIYVCMFLHCYPPDLWKALWINNGAAIPVKNIDITLWKQSTTARDNVHLHIAAMNSTIYLFFFILPCFCQLTVLFQEWQHQFNLCIAVFFLTKWKKKSQNLGTLLA